MNFQYASGITRRTISRASRVTFVPSEDEVDRTDPHVGHVRHLYQDGNVVGAVTLCEDVAQSEAASRISRFAQGGEKEELLQGRVERVFVCDRVESNRLDEMRAELVEPSLQKRAVSTDDAMKSSARTSEIRGRGYAERILCSIL